MKVSEEQLKVMKDAALLGMGKAREGVPESLLRYAAGQKSQEELLAESMLAHQQEMCAKFEEEHQIKIWADIKRQNRNAGTERVFYCERFLEWRKNV